MRCGQKNPPEDHCLQSLVMPNSDPEGRTFLSVPNNHDRFLFLHTFCAPEFDFSIGVAINELRSYMLTFATLKVDVVCDLLYNQYIDNTCCYSFLFTPQVG